MTDHWSNRVTPCFIHLIILYYYLTGNSSKRDGVLGKRGKEGNFDKNTTEHSSNEQVIIQLSYFGYL